MTAIFQKKNRWALWAFGAHFIFAAVVFAIEIDQIMPARESSPRCNNPMEYMEMDMDKINPPNPTKSNGPCNSCKEAITSAVKQANGKLTGAIAANSAINASNAASTAGTAAVNNQAQDGRLFGGGTVSNTGAESATQQSKLASEVAAEFENCAKTIEQSCPQGQLAPEDANAAKSSADSCKQSAQQARQVAADKAAKAEEMAQNGQQANQSGQGLQPPQMPQSGAGGSPGLGSSDPSDSKVSSSIERAKGAKLDTKISNGKAEIPVGKGADSGVSSETNTASTANGGGNSLGSGSSSPFGGGGEATAGSSGSNGVSGGGSLGSLGSGASSKPHEESSERKPASAEDALATAPAGGGGSRPTLGLKSSGDEFSDLLSPNAQEGSTTIGGNLESNAGSMKSIAFNNSLMDEISLFKRIKAKITKVTKDQYMQ